MDVLSTVFPLLAIAACWFFAWRAQHAEQQAKHEAHRIQQSRGRLVANELAIEELSASFKRLNGRVNAELHRRRGVVIEGEFTEQSQNVTPDAEPHANGLDPELAAELALQRAPAASPGRSGN